METLQRRLARGEAAAYEELYDACADRVGHYLFSRLGSWPDAEDALQDAFLRVARARRKLAKVENLTAFVFTVARNEAARLGRRRSRRQQRQQPLVAEDLFSRDANGNSVARQETAETVAAALGQLNPDLREVVELKTYGQLTFEQIGQVMGIPQGTAATRYRSALDKMQNWLARQS